MTVGDIHSQERGSGARFNTGKPPFELVSVTAIAASYSARYPLPEPDDFYHTEHRQAINVLFALGDFQSGGDIHSLSRAMGYLSEYWDACAHTFDYGLKKYVPWNWAKGMPWSVPIACAVRHCLAILDCPNLTAEDCVDLESGQHHFGHALCNLVMLFVYISVYPQGDDRPAQLRKEATLDTVTPTIIPGNLR